MDLQNKYDLTTGSISKKLLLVALPIMGVNFMQMAYNLTDMFWLGELGTDAVAAAGTAGMYLWLSQAFLIFGRTGAEIGVSQNIGKGDKEAAKKYAETSITLSVILGIAFMMLLIIFRNPLIGFFGIKEDYVVKGAVDYLVFVSIGIPFTFVSGAISGCFSGYGNTKIPFYINFVGLIINMILDPVLIFVFDMGIVGAAIATVVAQIIVCIALLVVILYPKHSPFEELKMFKIPEKEHLKNISIWSVPIAVESLLFTFLSMLVARIVPQWGEGAIAVQKVGSQVESLSWLISGGFGTAVTAFVGQNYGGEKWARIHKGYKISAGLMAIWGTITTILLFFFGEFFISIFLKEKEYIIMGGEYLKILSSCQLILCIEAVTAGLFRGIGKTLPPSIASVCSNAFRVPLAYFLSRTSLGLNGVWIGVTIGAIIRGVWIFAWYLYARRGMPKVDAVRTDVA